MNRCAILPVVVLLPLLLAALGPIAAQDPDAPEKPTPQDENDYQAMVRDGAVSNAAVLEKVARYKTYSFTLPANLESLPKLRRALKGDLQRADRAGTKNAHDELNRILLDEMYQLAIGRLPEGEHLSAPVNRTAVQVNAMLMVGDLNQQEGAGQDPPVPLAVALPKLVAALSMPDVPDAVKAVALQGIRRHAELGIADEEQRGNVQKAMLELLATTSPPPTRDPSVQLWLRQSAAEVLGGIGAAGLTKDSAEVVEALLAVIADGQQPLAIRASAAQALGQIDLKSPQGINLSLAAHQVGRLAVDIAKTKPEGIARMKGQFQRVNSALVGAADGRGMAAAVDETHKPFLDGLQQQIAPIKQAVDKLDGETSAVPKAIHDQAAALSKWLDENVPQSKDLLANKTGSS